MGCPNCGSYLAPANNLCGICQAAVYRVQTLQMQQIRLMREQQRMMRGQPRTFWQWFSGQ